MKNSTTYIFGITAGIIFGVLDILPMLFSGEVHTIELMGAFSSRFAIGFIIPFTKMNIPGWLSGTFISVLISLSAAFITGNYLPIIISGALGGAVIGFAWDKVKNKTSS